MKAKLGELLGTFIFVFIGCSTVALSVLGIAFPTLLQVAVVWGIGVALAIYAVRTFCPAHLNPAVSLAFFLDKKISLSTLLSFMLFQLIGAFLAGGLVFLLFNSSILQFEEVNSIVRGTDSSRLSAKIFGEFFPNPGSYITQVPSSVAMLAEALGTFILMFTIFLVVNTRKQIEAIAPLLIGLTVTIIILLFAPYTQGGFNPARDFGPRLIAYLGGWGQATFPSVSYGFFTVYILAPLVGGMTAKGIFQLSSKFIYSKK